VTTASTSTNANSSDLTEIQSRAIAFFWECSRDRAIHLAGAAERLRQAYSSIPWRANRAQKDPDYRLWLTAGQGNS